MKMTTYRVLLEVKPLGDLIGKKPEPNQIWFNYTADIFGVMDFEVSEIITKPYGKVWIKNNSHNGVLRSMLDLCFIFTK